MDIITNKSPSMIVAFVVTVTLVRVLGFLCGWWRRRRAVVDGAFSLTAGRSTTIIYHFLLPFLQEPLKAVRLPAWFLVLRLPLVCHTTLVEKLAGFSLCTDIIKFHLKYHKNRQNWDGTENNEVGGVEDVVVEEWKNILTVFWSFSTAPPPPPTSRFWPLHVWTGLGIIRICM